MKTKGKLGIAKTKAIADGIMAHSMLYDPVRKDDSQLHFIYDLARQAPDGIAVEVGVKEGGSIVTWAQARHGRGQVIAVDNRRTQGYRKALLDKLAGYGIEAVLLEVDSWNGAALVNDRVAFCFVDAGHSYAEISKDITAWTPKIKPGGIIAYHDYGVWKITVGVKKAVDEWQAQARWEPLGIAGALIAFRRPEHDFT